VSSDPDPEITALSTICNALLTLASDEARRRVLEFARDKFNLGAPSRVGGSHKAAGAPTGEEEPDQENDDLLSRFDHKKPADNVALLVAGHYAKYGTQSFTVSAIKTQADQAGITVPARIDKTLEGGGRKGKRFYQRLSAGTFRVTVHGEAFLKNTYGVKKGNRRTTPEPDTE
jgi:hypothetical protein